MNLSKVAQSGANHSRFIKANISILDKILKSPLLVTVAFQHTPELFTAYVEVSLSTDRTSEIRFAPE